MDASTCLQNPASSALFEESPHINMLLISSYPLLSPPLLLDSRYEEETLVNYVAPGSIVFLMTYHQSSCQSIPKYPEVNNESFSTLPSAVQQSMSSPSQSQSCNSGLPHHVEEHMRSM